MQRRRRVNLVAPRNRDAEEVLEYAHLTPIGTAPMMPSYCLPCGRLLPPHIFEKYAAEVARLQAKKDDDADELPATAGDAEPPPPRAYLEAHDFFVQQGLLLPERECCRATVVGSPELLETVRRVARRPAQLKDHVALFRRGGGGEEGRTYFDRAPQQPKWLLQEAPMPPLLRAWAQEYTPFSIVTNGCKELLYALLHHIKSRSYEFTVPGVPEKQTVALHFKDVGDVYTEGGTTLAPLFGDLHVTVADRHLSRRHVFLGAVPVAASHRSVLHIQGTDYTPLLRETVAANYILVTSDSRGILAKVVSHAGDGWTLKRSILPLVLHMVPLKKRDCKLAEAAAAWQDCVAYDMPTVVIKWRDDAETCVVPVVALLDRLRGEPVSSEQLESMVLAEAPRLRDDARLLYPTMYKPRVQAWCRALCYSAHRERPCSDAVLEKLQNCLLQLDGIGEDEGRGVAKAHFVVRMLARLLEVLLGLRQPDDANLYKSYVGVARALVSETVSALADIQRLFRAGGSDEGEALRKLPLANRVVQPLNRHGCEVVPQKAASLRNRVLLADGGGAPTSASNNKWTILAASSHEGASLCAHCGMDRGVGDDASPVCGRCGSAHLADELRAYSATYSPVKLSSVSELEAAGGHGDAMATLALYLMNGVEHSLRSTAAPTNIQGQLSKLLSNKEHRSSKDASNLGQRAQVSVRVSPKLDMAVGRFLRTNINPHSTDVVPRRLRLSELHFVEYREIDETNPGRRGAMAIGTLFSVRPLLPPLAVSCWCPPTACGASLGKKRARARPSSPTRRYARPSTRPCSASTRCRRGASKRCAGRRRTCGPRCRRAPAASSSTAD
jgi:hypothetical protein